MSTSHEPRMTGTKTCKECGVPKQVICFSADKTMKDGLCGYCRDCKSEKDKHNPTKQNKRHTKALIRKQHFYPFFPFYPPK